MKKFNFYLQLKDNFSWFSIIGIVTLAFVFAISIYNRVTGYKHHAFFLNNIFSYYRWHQIFEDIIFYSAIAIIISYLFYLGYKHDNDQEMIFNLQKEIKALETQWRRLSILDLNSQSSQKSLNNQLRIFNNVNRRLINKLRQIGGIDPGINYFLEIIEDDISEIADDISGDDLEPDALIPLNCLDCKYYLDNKYLHCSVHPNLETDCPDFETGKQLEERYFSEDDDEEEVANRVDWIIDRNYITAALEKNPDNILIGCSCGYPLFVSLGNFQDGNNICRSYSSYTYFTCLLSDNNRKVAECPNCNTHLL